MLSLSPLKMVVVILVALVLVGPDKLPGLARQIGGAWKAFRSVSSKLEDEVRSSMPDLPSSGDIARFARSPVALLDSLAKLEDTELSPDPGAAPIDQSEHLVADPGAPARAPASNKEPPDEAASPEVLPPGSITPDRTVPPSGLGAASGPVDEPTAPETPRDRPPTSGFDPSLN